MAIYSQPIKNIDTGINTIFHVCSWCGELHDFFPQYGNCRKCGRS